MYVSESNVFLSIMPKFGLSIKDLEELDSKLMGMCERNEALLIQDGGTFANIFPAITGRSRVFHRRYGIPEKAGLLLFTRLGELVLMFDERENKAQLQVKEKDIAICNDVLKDVWDKMVGIDTDKGSYKTIKVENSRQSCYSKTTPAAGEEL